MRQFGELGIRWIGRSPPNPASESELRTFERTFRVKLPEDYLRFLREVNGGSPTKRRFRGDGEEWAVEDLYFLAPPEVPTREEVGMAAEDGIDFGNLWDETKFLREQMAEPLIPIAGDALGDQIVLDYRSKPVAIAIVDYEQNRRIRPVAGTFSEFLDMLY